MSGTLIIREATAADVPAIAAMMEEFFDYLCALDGSTSDFDRTAGEQRLMTAGFGDRPRFSALVAEAADGPLGYAMFNFIYWPDTLKPTLLLSDLFVRRSQRGTGIGKAIMSRLAEIGRSEGCEQIMWTVWRPNAAAGAFYRRLGAEELPDEYVMRLAIA